MRKRLNGGIIVVILYIIMIIILWSNSGNAAEYATYMRVVGFNSVYVQVVDGDGQQWEVQCKSHTVKGKKLKKGMNVLVIMNLEYDTDKCVMLIGDTYIEDIF